MSDKNKEHFERVIATLRGNGTLNPGQAAAALDGYDNAITEIETFEKLKAEDEAPAPVTRDGEKLPRTTPRTKGE